MKAIFIVYNQAHTEKVEYMFERLDIRGFTRWTDLTGRGSETGNPHMNTHTWPGRNGTSARRPHIVYNDGLAANIFKLKIICSLTIDQDITIVMSCFREEDINSGFFCLLFSGISA